MSSASKVAEFFRKGRAASHAALALSYSRYFVEDTYRQLSLEYEWTPERVDLLCKMWVAQVPVAHIAVRLECSPALVSRKASAIGLKTRKSSAALADRKPVPDTSARSCMCCGRSFYSEGKHNRLCQHCKNNSNLDYATPSFRGNGARF